eukprot:4081107-Pyramimonas_sp.AAC.1
MTWRIRLLTHAPSSCLKGPRRHPWQKKSALFCSFVHHVSRSSTQGGRSVTPGRGPKWSGRVQVQVRERVPPANPGDAACLLRSVVREADAGPEHVDVERAYRALVVRQG